MERDTAVSGVDADRQSGPFLKHVDILRVASKKLASDAQSIEQTMCLRRPRDEGFLTKLPRDFEQTRTPFWGTCRAFGEDLSLPVETIVRPEVLKLIGVSTSAADKEDAPTTKTSITARTYSRSI
ncbi:hypothetical protein PLICBS_010086 [Purpureocillium lilacinum]|uniref:uncharacterized protein n=1 Tax=Purpureocillium lilacinum TaxID=33203 RepID=UPI002088F2F6|nr:hypothetical protein PLICBS_010086 [Purpureocillium lilacinum]